MSGLGKPEFHLYDNDKDEYRRIVRNINGENDDKKKAFNTRKLELENYLSSKAIQDAYRENGVDIIMPEIGDEVDVPFLVAQLAYQASGSNWDDLDDDKRKEKASDKKKFLNSQAVAKMSVECLVQRDGLDEMIMWFNEMALLCGIQKELAA